MKHFESIHWSAEAAPKVFYKKGVFKNFVKFTGKHLCQSIFFIKLQTYGLKQTTAYGIKIVLIGN